VPGIILMENAGRALAEHAGRMLSGKSRISILCGSGKNGGDGFCAARHLASMGHKVKVGFFGRVERLPYEALQNYNMLSPYPVEVYGLEEKGIGEVLDALHDCDLVIDCLLGTGTKGPPRYPFDKVISWANALPVPV